MNPPIIFHILFDEFQKPGDQAAQKITELTGRLQPVWSK